MFVSQYYFTSHLDLIETLKQIFLFQIMLFVCNGKICCKFNYLKCINSECGSITDKTKILGIQNFKLPKFPFLLQDEVDFLIYEFLRA